MGLVMRQVRYLDASALVTFAKRHPRARGCLLTGYGEKSSHAASAQRRAQTAWAFVDYEIDGVNVPTVLHALQKIPIWNRIHMKHAQQSHTASGSFTRPSLRYRLPIREEFAGQVSTIATRGS